MDMYTYYIRDLKKYPSNHYRHMRLKKLVNEHISGLRLTSQRLRGTSVAKFCDREANRYEKMLSEESA